MEIIKSWFNYIWNFSFLEGFELTFGLAAAALAFYALVTYIIDNIKGGRK